MNLLYKHYEKILPIKTTLFGGDYHAHRSDDGWRLPAGSLEDAAMTPIRNLLQDQIRLMDLLDLEDHSPAVLNSLNTQSHNMANQLFGGVPGTRYDILEAVIQRIVLSPETITITLSRKGLALMLQVCVSVSTQDHGDAATITVPFTLRRRGVETKLVIAGPDTEQRHPDPKLCRLIAQANKWFDQLAAGKVDSVRAIARRENIYETEVSRILPIAFLSPTIIGAILEGCQPEELTVKSLKRFRSLPSDWEAQKIMLQLQANNK